jgi:hypothetical protein
MIFKDKYQPPIYLKNGHINTMFTFVKRKIEGHPGFFRQRYETPDEDFFDVDTIQSGNDKAAILLHGLEGSTQSQYIMGMSSILASEGWDVYAINHRSCSGEMNRTLGFYHSGFTKDLAQIVDTISAQYNSIICIGYSLGGNMVLKYMGSDEHLKPDNLRLAIGVSVPTDLKGGSFKLKRFENKIYTKRFIIDLAVKIKYKAEKFPGAIDISHLPKLKQLMDFDDHYTAPLHGFKDALDYYAKSNSKQFLSSIEIPTLLINALDDPFLSDSCHPYEIAENSKHFDFVPVRYGGHVGFYQKGIYSYVDGVVLDYIKSIYNR